MWLRNFALFNECRGDDTSSELAAVDGEDGNGDDGDDGIDDDDEDDEAWLSSSNFLLSTLLLLFPSVSPLIMQSFIKRFTSDSFTGLTRNSSAPSSKQL